MNTVPAEAAALAGDRNRHPAPQSEAPSPCGAARGQNVAPGNGGSPGRDSTPSPFGTSERKAIPTKNEPEKSAPAKGRTLSEERLAGDASPQSAKRLAGDASPQPAERFAGDAPFQSAERLTSNAPFQSSRHLGTGDASPQPAHPARTAERAANVSRETFAFEQVEQCSMPASRHRRAAQDHAAAPDRAASRTTDANDTAREAGGAVSAGDRCGVGSATGAGNTEGAGDRCDADGTTDVGSALDASDTRSADGAENAARSADATQGASMARTTRWRQETSATRAQPQGGARMKRKARPHGGARTMPHAANGTRTAETAQTASQQRAADTARKAETARTAGEPREADVPRAASSTQTVGAANAANSAPRMQDTGRSGDGARTQNATRKRPSKASADVSRETPASHQEKRRTLRRKRAVAITGLAALCAGIVALWALYGPELLAFVADAPRFRAWVDEAGALSRIAFVMANMAQIVIAFLPGEPLELAAGYAFGALEGTLWCLVASALGTAAVMALVRTFGLRIVALFFPPEKIASMRWLRDARRFELLLFLCFLIPGTPKDLFTYVAGLGKSPVARIVALTTVGRIPSIVSSTLMAGAFGDGNYLGAAAVAALTVALAGIGVITYRKLSSKHIFIENSYQ